MMFSTRGRSMNLRADGVAITQTSHPSACIGDEVGEVRGWSAAARDQVEDGTLVVAAQPDLPYGSDVANMDALRPPMATAPLAIRNCRRSTTSACVVKGRCCNRRKATCALAALLTSTSGILSAAAIQRRMFGCATLPWIQPCTAEGWTVVFF